MLVYPMCVVSVELGNKLGNYFNEVACAEQSGMHFLAINKQWHLVDDAHSSSINPNHTQHDKYSIIHSLPRWSTDFVYLLTCIGITNRRNCICF